MPNYVLSDADRKLIADVVQRSLSAFQPRRAEYDNPQVIQTPDVYLVQAPEDGIAAGEAAECEVFRVNPDPMYTTYAIEDAQFTITVYNPPDNADIPGGVGTDGGIFLVAERDKFGTWLATGGSSGGCPCPCVPGIITEYPCAAYGNTASGFQDFIHGICTGPDGNLWTTGYHGSDIIRVTPEGVVTIFPITNTSHTFYWIIVGPDGNLWFTDNNAKVWVFNLTTHTATSYSVGTTNYGICVGPDNNIWVANFGGTPSIIVLSASGSILHTYTTGVGTPFAICAGSDGNLWFSNLGGSTIVKMNTSGSVLATYASHSSTSNTWLCPVDPGPGTGTGSLGEIWFCSSGPSTTNIGYIDILHGSVTTFGMPYQGAPAGICLGSDGNIYVGNGGSNGNFVARVTPAGVITPFFTPSLYPSIIAICAGPDGNIWFAESNSLSLGVLCL